MKILIVSDTHGYNDNYYRVLEKVGEPDLLIHAGDVSGCETEIRNSVKCDVKMVAGNNDFSGELKREEEFEAGGIRFLLVHGHRESVYYGTDRLFYKAAQYGVDVVVYGHTHNPSIEYDDEFNIWAVNPGSLTYPRQGGHKPSFILMDIDREGEPHFTLNFL